MVGNETSKAQKTEEKKNKKPTATNTNIARNEKKNANERRMNGKNNC